MNKLMMKMCLFVLALGLTSCGHQKVQQSSNDIEDGLNREAILDSPNGTSTHAFTGNTPTIELPKMMMPGPIDPIPSEGETPILMMAYLGPFTTLGELHASPFYAQLCSVYPELKGIDNLIDTGQGDLWLIRPWSEGISLAINEYNMAMFNGEQEDSSGEIYLRTEQAEPLLLRMNAYDPGSVHICAVDNDGHQLSFIPTLSPQDNRLRTEPGVMNYSFNPADNSVEYGDDYTAQLTDGCTLSARFYANHLLRLGDQLLTYMAFLQEDGGVGIYIAGPDIETYALLDGMAPDQGFSLKVVRGSDLGFGIGKALRFKNNAADDETE